MGGGKSFKDKPGMRMFRGRVGKRKGRENEVIK